MEKRSGQIRTLALVLSAAFFVVLLVGGVSYFSANGEKRTGIVLPAQGGESPGPDVFEQNNDGFISVDKHNVAQVIDTLTRPNCYRQKLLRTNYTAQAPDTATVELLVRENKHRISVTEGSEIRYFLTDGNDTYLWHNQNSGNVTKLNVPDTVRPDHIAGILTYESIANYPADRILEIDFVQYPETESAPCLYVRVQEDAETETEFWVNMNTGLLCKAEQTVNNVVVYQLVEQGLTLFDTNDNAVAQQLLLPDGTNPFLTEEE